MEEARWRFSDEVVGDLCRQCQSQAPVIPTGAPRVTSFGVSAESRKILHPASYGSANIAESCIEPARSRKDASVLITKKDDYPLTTQ